MPSALASDIARSIWCDARRDVKGPYPERSSRRLSSKGSVEKRNAFSLTTTPRTGLTRPGIICRNSALTSEHP